MNIEIYKNKEKIEYKRFLFPAGEIGVKLNVTPKHKYLDGTIRIVARLQNSEDVITLALIKNALNEAFDNLSTETPIFLYLLYLPYGRQDRVCDKGESFSLKVFANLINSLKFDRVYLFDPHSNVAPALFDKVSVFTQFDIINRNQEFIKKCLKGGCFIAPDAGANKKTSEVAKFFDRSDFVRADKLRDLTNGNILETIVYQDNFEGKNVICVDDLIDGGKTFIELAKICKKKNCGEFILYGTHGIFSKGLDILLENGVDQIFTTDSYRTDLHHEKLTVLDLNNFISDYD